MTVDPENLARLSTKSLKVIDENCWAFEQHWQSSQKPSIESYLNGFSGSERQILLGELVALDLDYRRRRGESPQYEQYAKRFPEAQRALQNAFESHANGAGDTARGNQTKLQQPTPIRKADFPEKIGRYRLGEVLGVGGFATVCRAHDDELQREVAIKIPHPDHLKRLGGAELFLNEARTLATLSHPSIATIYDFGRLSEQGSCYLVSQYIDQGDLEQRMKAQPLSAVEAIQVVISIARALHYAHAKGFVHRDVKPSNILIDSDNKAFLADFGLALEDIDAGKNRFEFAGTRAYMSPEQIRGEVNLVDGRADIYGLGVVLYELLTGRQPLGSDEIDHRVDDSKTRSPKPPRQINDQISRDVERICLKALQKSPADRFTTAKDMADELEQAIQPDIGNSTFRWNPAVAMGSLVMLVMILIVFLKWGTIPNSPETYKDADALTSIENEPIRSIAVLPFQAIKLPASEDYLGLSLADALVMRLSNVKGLEVRPIGAVRKYEEKGVDPVEAGLAVNVDAVIDASIQKIEAQTRVTVQIIRTADGKSLWSGTFEERLHDAFTLQDSIAEKITKSIERNLHREPSDVARPQHIPDPRAYESYLKGRFHWHQRSTKANALETIRYFKDSIRMDPLFALAHVGLAECYAVLDYYDYYEIDSAMPLAKASAQQALHLDATLPDAHRVLALVEFAYQWNWESAEQKYLRVIELNPNDATAHQWYGEFLMYVGRFEESKFHLQKAAKLNPLSPVIYAIRGSPFLFDRDIERAREKFNDALQIYPDSVIAQYGLAICFEAEGDFQSALAIYQRNTVQFEHSCAGTIGIGYCLGQLGRVDEAIAILESHQSFKDGRRFSSYGLATIYAAIGDKDRAFEFLDQAYEERDDYMIMLNVDPKLDTLRSDPRFDELKRVMAFPIVSK